jgi:hypothetical protein
VAVTWARRIWSTVGLIVIVVTGVAVHDQTDTTYVGSDPRLLWSQVAVALALLGAGALTVSPRRSLALAALGGLWLVPELAGWRTGPPTLRSLAAGVACLLPAQEPVVSAGGVDRACGAQQSRVGGRPAQVAFAVAYGFVVDTPAFPGEGWVERGLHDGRIYRRSLAGAGGGSCQYQQRGRRHRGDQPGVET